MFRLLTRRFSAAAFAGSGVVSPSECSELVRQFKEHKSKDTLQRGKTLLETGFWPEGQSMSFSDACDVMQAAVQFRPRITASVAPAVHAAVKTIEMCPDDIEPALCASALAGVTALHHPRQFHVLFRHLARLRDDAFLERLTIENLSTISSALGRSGTKHELVTRKLASRAAVLLPNATNIAHVANIAYAFAHCDLPGEDPVWAELGAATLRLVDQSVPLVTATLLNAYSRVWTQPQLAKRHAAVVKALERSAIARVEEMPPALLSSVILSTGLFKRDKFSIASAPRCMATVQTFGPAHVADVFRGFKLLHYENMDVMGLLAERASNDIKRYRTRDIVAVVDSLTHFGLIDLQLFDLAGNHVIENLRNKVLVDVNLLAQLLACLTTASFKNKLLGNALNRVALDAPEALTAEGAKALVVAFNAFGIVPQGKLQERINALCPADAPKIGDTTPPS
jgi:hypothetical protein